MALAGTLKDFGLPDIFQLIGLQKKTGILHLKNASESATLTFDQGNVVDAESSLQRNSDRIGIVLVNQGSISKEQLEEALKTLGDHDVRIKLHPEVVATLKVLVTKEG